MAGRRQPRPTPWRAAPASQGSTATRPSDCSACPSRRNVLPTASSVIVFQLAENQTLNVPVPGLEAAAAGAVAATTVVGAGGAPPPAGGVVGLAAVWGAVELPAGGGLPQAASARPTTQALRARNCLRENVVRGSEATHNPPPERNAALPHCEPCRGQIQAPASLRSAPKRCVRYTRPWAPMPARSSRKAVSDSRGSCVGT